MSNRATPPRSPSIKVRNSRKLAGTLAARNSRKKEMNISDPLQRLLERGDLRVGPGIAVVPEIEQRILVERDPPNDVRRPLPKNPASRLFATISGGSAIRTEKLGWLRPGWTKYL